MFATECSLGTATSTPELAREDMIRSENSAAHQLRAVAGLCNAADFDSETLSLPLSERRIFGDATDQAALRFSESLGPVSELRKAWKGAFELAFDSKHKFMAKAFTLGETRGLTMCLSPVEATDFQKADNMYVEHRAAYRASIPSPPLPHNLLLLARCPSLNHSKQEKTSTSWASANCFTKPVDS